jgi:RNA polymerase sigma-70 factor (ECF subfamily)
LHTTSLSLLEQIRGPDQTAAWNRFVRLYTPLLYSWAHRLGLAADDAADLVQEIFLLLLRKLPEFEYDPSRRFRAWLWTLTRNKYRDFRKARVSLPVGNLPELPDNNEGDEGIAEAEYRAYLVARCLELAREEFEVVTWTAFQQYVIAGRPVAEVAAQLGISANAVYLAKSRVLRRLREELAGLLD